MCIFFLMQSFCCCFFFFDHFFYIFFFRNTDQSHFAAQSVHFLPNSTQATRITSVMCTGNSWTVKSCSTVHTARLLQARELWRRMLKYSTYPIQLGTIMEAHRELRWGKLILIDTNRETVWRKQCISAKNAHFGTRYTMW